MSVQILRAIYELHRQDIVHGDLKHENLLLHIPDGILNEETMDDYLKNWNYERDPIQIVLSDFGISRKTSTQTVDGDIVPIESHVKGTLLTPREKKKMEVGEEIKVTETIDIRHFGHTLYGILNLSYTSEKKLKLENCEPISTYVLEVIAACINKKDGDVPSAADLFGYEFF